MEQITALFAEYGLWIVLIGTFFEGETVVVVGGFAAHQNFFSPYAVAALAFCGTFVGDQFWFILSRHFQDRPLIRKATEQPTFGRALHFLERHPIKFILAYRFVYGVRNVSIIAIGLSAIPAHRFFVLNMIAASVWAAAFTSIGFVFADTAESFLGGLKTFEHMLLTVFAIAAFVYLLYWLARRYFGRPLKG
jgi:membrane protein DedA with SNARE-associated domain